MKNFYTDPWIPVSGATDLASLKDLIEDGDRYESINCQPMTRISIIRLLQAITAVPVVDSAYFDRQTFLQVGGLPESSCRAFHDIIDMSDKNSIAFDPLSKKNVLDSVIGQAIVSAYFCDRGGLKARIEGLPISAQTPLHVGMNIQMRKGATIGEMLRNNTVSSKGEYQPPWITCSLNFPAYTTPKDELELLLWPWRRLQLFENGLTIAPGALINKDVVDPWAASKSKLYDIGSRPDDGYEVTHFVLNQALPVACWISS